MEIENRFQEISHKAYNDWLAQVDNPDAETLTALSQRYFDEAYQQEVFPFAVKVRRIDTPCGHTFLRFSKEDEILAECEIKFECGKKDCPHAATCGSGEPKCAVHQLMQMV